MASDWTTETSKKKKKIQETEELHYNDFLIQPTEVDYSYQPHPTTIGVMYLFYGDSNSGKSYTGGTWFDNECACGAKIVSPQKGQIKACPLCEGKKIQKRPIVSIDFELGRGETLRRNQFPNKNYLIIEPRILQEDWNPMEDDDATDVVASLDKFIKSLLALWNDIKNGLIHPSCIIVDSATDVWSIVQEWGLQELIRYHKDYSKKNAKLMRTEVQLDWKVPNNRHFKIVQICRAILKLGVDIIWTARYEGPPAYVKDGTQKIRAQKDVSFFSDIRVHMEHRVAGKNNQYTSHIEKLEGYETPTEAIDRINYIEIQKILKEAKAKKEEALSEEVEAILI